MDTTLSTPVLPHPLETQQIQVSTALNPVVSNSVPQDGKYHLNKYPTYSHPERHLDRMRRDHNLRLMVARKFLLMTPYRGQYVRMQRNKEGKPVAYCHPKEANYVPGTITLTTRVLERHLTYTDRFAVAVLFHDPHTIGATNIRWAMFDIDIPHFEVAKEAAIKIGHECSRRGLKAHISFSGGKGFHVELFFRAPGINSADFHGFHQYVLNMCGVQATIQDVVDQEKLARPSAKPGIEARPEVRAGQAAKLPLAIHPKTGALAGYVIEDGGDLVEVADPYEYFLAIPFDNDPAIVHHYADEWWAEERRRASEEATKNVRVTGHQKRSKQGNNPEHEQRRSTAPKIKPCPTLQQHVEAIQAEAASIMPDSNALDTTELAAERPIIENILENGLLPGKKRNDTTFTLLKLMRRYYTKNDAIAIVIPWIEEVLYPKCRTDIEMPMEEHIIKTRDMIDWFWSHPPSGLSIEVHPEQIRRLTEYTEQRNTINLPKFRLLLAIFLHAEFAKAAGMATDDGFAPLAVEYLRKVTAMSPNAVLKYRDELIDQGVISLQPGTPYQIVRNTQGKGHLDKSSAKPQMLRVNVTCSDWNTNESTITVTKMMACQRAVCAWLLTKSFGPDLKRTLGGSQRHYRKWCGVIKEAEVFGH